MNRARTFGLLCAFVLTAGTARAQAFYLGHAPTDSQLGVLSSAPMSVDVRIGDGSYAYVQTAYLTLHYDPAAVHVSGVAGVPGDSILFVDSSQAGAFKFATNGCVGGIDFPVARLRMRLDAAAASGAVVYLTADSAQSSQYCYYAIVPAFYGAAMTSACTATALYGDVDANSAIDSRDALIALSKAVGLPVSGFDFANADVDGDGLVNSRDALVMLSYAIGLPTGTARVGMGVPAACPASTPPGELVVLRQRGSASYYDSVAVLDSSSTVPTIVPAGFYQPVAPRLAADGKSIVSACSVFYSGLCRAQRDGTGFRTLLGQDGDYGSPDWNPTGDSLAMIRFVSGARWPALSDSNGGNLRQLATNAAIGNGYAGAIAWNRTGTGVAYVNSDGTIWTVNHDSSGNAQVPIAGVTDAQSVRWSPGNDSLAFTRAGEPGIWVVAAVGGTPVQRTTFASLGQVSGLRVGFDWGPQGIIFASEEPGRMGLWLLAPGGTLARVTSGPHIEPSFRRNP